MDTKLFMVKIHNHFIIHYPEQYSNI